MTINDIKQHMLNYLGNPVYEDDGYYDDDGHCGDQLYNMIIGFWQEFNTEKDLLYVVSGKWISDDLDLEGGRDYILSRCGVIPMLFDYLYNNMGVTKEKYENIIYNSLGITDEIEDMFDGISVVRDVKINTITDENINIVLEDTPKKSEDESDFIVLKYSSSMRHTLDTLSNFEFVGNSKLDGDPIYKMKVPKGYKIVDKVNI